MSTIAVEKGASLLFNKWSLAKEIVLDDNRWMQAVLFYFIQDPLVWIAKWWYSTLDHHLG